MSYKNKGVCLECGNGISKGETSCLCPSCFGIEKAYQGTTFEDRPPCRFPLCSGNEGSGCWPHCDPLAEPPALDVKLRNPKGVAARNKVSASLVPEIAIIELAQAFRNGSLKYGPFNWRKEEIATSVYLDAIERHLMLYRAGQDVASDSALSHLTHIMSSCAILIDAELQGSLIDDREKWADPDLLESVLDDYRVLNET